MTDQGSVDAPKPRLRRRVCVWTAVALTGLVASSAVCEVDPKTGEFTYSGMGGVDDSLGRIALFLMDQKQVEGNAYVSPEVEKGIVGYQLRYSDDGNMVVDGRDWFSVRRYTIPTVPDTNQAVGYYKSDYLELVDLGLDGLDQQDYFFVRGRRFDLKSQPPDMIKQYQIQIESGVSAYINDVGYATITGETGATGQTAIRKVTAYEDGSLPAQIILGLDLRYVFRPIDRPNLKLDQDAMAQEIRRNLGLVYNATLTFTDITGYQLRDLATETLLIQRTFDPIETKLLTLVIDALFDTDGDGIITPEDLQRGYDRFRELHQALVENVRGGGRRIILPNEKLARIRQEYEAVHGKPFEL